MSGPEENLSGKFVFVNVKIEILFAPFVVCRLPLFFYRRQQNAFCVAVLFFNTTGFFLALSEVVSICFSVAIGSTGSSHVCYCFLYACLVFPSHPQMFSLSFRSTGSVFSCHSMHFTTSLLVAMQLTTAPVEMPAAPATSGSQFMQGTRGLAGGSRIVRRHRRLPWMNGEKPCGVTSAEIWLPHSSGHKPDRVLPRMPVYLLFVPRAHSEAPGGSDAISVYRSCYVSALCQHSSPDIIEPKFLPLTIPKYECTFEFYMAQRSFYCVFIDQSLYVVLPPSRSPNKMSRTAFCDVSFLPKSNSLYTICIAVGGWFVVAIRTQISSPRPSICLINNRPLLPIMSLMSIVCSKWYNVDNSIPRATEIPLVCVARFSIPCKQILRFCHKQTMYLPAPRPYCFCVVFCAYYFQQSVFIPHPVPYIRKSNSSRAMGYPYRGDRRVEAGNGTGIYMCPVALVIFYNRSPQVKQNVHKNLGVLAKIRKFFIFRAVAMTSAIEVDNILCVRDGRLFVFEDVTLFILNSVYFFTPYTSFEAQIRVVCGTDLFTSPAALNRLQNEPRTYTSNNRKCFFARKDSNLNLRGNSAKAIKSKSIRAHLPPSIPYDKKTNTLSIFSHLGAAYPKKSGFFRFSLLRAHNRSCEKNRYIEVKSSKNFTFDLHSSVEMRRPLSNSYEFRDSERPYCHPILVQTDSSTNLRSFLISMTSHPSKSLCEDLILSEIYYLRDLLERLKICLANSVFIKVCMYRHEVDNTLCVLGGRHFVFEDVKVFELNSAYSLTPCTSFEVPKEEVCGTGLFTSPAVTLITLISYPLVHTSNNRSFARKNSNLNLRAKIVKALYANKTKSIRALLPPSTAYDQKMNTLSIFGHLGADPHGKCRFCKFSFFPVHNLRCSKNLYIQVKFSKNLTLGLHLSVEMGEAAAGPDGHGDSERPLCHLNPVQTGSTTKLRPFSIVMTSNSLKSLHKCPVLANLICLRGYFQRLKVCEAADSVFTKFLKEIFTEIPHIPDYVNKIANCLPHRSSDEPLSLVPTYMTQLSHDVGSILGPKLPKINMERPALGNRRCPRARKRNFRNTNVLVNPHHHQRVADETLSQETRPELTPTSPLHTDMVNSLPPVVELTYRLRLIVEHLREARQRRKFNCLAVVFNLPSVNASESRRRAYKRRLDGSTVVEHRMDGFNEDQSFTYRSVASLSYDNG